MVLQLYLSRKSQITELVEIRLKRNVGEQTSFLKNSYQICQEKLHDGKQTLLREYEPKQNKTKTKMLRNSMGKIKWTLTTWEKSGNEEQRGRKIGPMHLYSLGGTASEMACYYYVVCDNVNTCKILVIRYWIVPKPR